MDWEEKISKKCNEYRNNKIAVIHKVPTEIKMIRKYDPILHKSSIVNAFPVEESKFVDYVGVFKGAAIAIEAKKTDNKTNFPFKNIKQSQFTFFTDWISCGGIGYYLFYFKTLNLYYLVSAKNIQNSKKSLNRQSIPVKWFQDKNNTIQLDENLNFLEYIEKDIKDGN